MSTTPETALFGLIGLGVMGENLALNVEDHGERVALWTHSASKVERFVEANSGRRWIATRTLKEFVAALATPRRILLVVKAGRPVDEMLDRFRRSVVAGIPLPPTSAALAYFDSYRTARLPQNLTQAQRDYFGAHTYRRIDRPEAGPAHTDWQEKRP